MESADSTRLKLILGKYRVISVRDELGYLHAVIDLGRPMKMIVQLPRSVDVREGDLLTLYTEVLTHAQSEGTPVQ
jgi:hypothetical protein